MFSTRKSSRKLEWVFSRLKKFTVSEVVFKNVVGWNMPIGHRSIREMLAAKRLKINLEPLVWVNRFKYYC